jgi:hypothetical protein
MYRWEPKLGQKRIIAPNYTTLAKPRPIRNGKKEAGQGNERNVKEDEQKEVRQEKQH